MELYRNTLKRRLTLAAGYNAILLVLIGSSHIFGSLQRLRGVEWSFAVGMLIGIQFVLIAHMTKWRRAMKSEESLKRLYIVEHDERTKFIRAKIGGVGINILVAGLAAAAICASFLHTTVFITLLAALLFTLLVQLALKIYYRKKV